MSGKIYEIRDVVYGFVLLDEQEWAIINHSAFQRLRRVKQLALTDMLYPGATHTRFEHSIGVMQMATDIYESIMRKPRARALLEERYDLSSEGIGRLRKIVRLAALLHDIGHPPFSHAGEELMPIKKRARNSKKTTKFEHEDYSIAIIKEKFKDLIEEHPVSKNFPIRVEEVTVLLGDKETKYSLSPLYMLFKEIISGQLDADRADYLLRDSHHLGVSYGLYDRARLVNSIDVGIHPETDDLVLAVQRGGWQVAESLVLARYQMFSQVYFHHTRRIYDYHTTCAAKEVLKHEFPKTKGYYPDPSKIDDYLKFDDWYMFGKIKEGFGGKHGGIILNRRHYRKVVETGIIPTEEDIRNIKAESGKYKKEGIAFFDDTIDPKWYKTEKDIRICVEGSEYVSYLSNVSPIVRAMVEAPRTRRLYVEKEEA